MSDDRWRIRGPIAATLATYFAFPDHPMKGRFESWLTRIMPKNLTLFGHDVELRFETKDWITLQILKHGHYERESISLMKRILCDGGTFVDVGANVGLYSCIASKLGGVRVIAVEPSPDSFIRLAHNLYANSAENVELVQTALGHRNSLALLHRPSATNSGSSRVLFHRERLSKGVVVSCISYAELANYVSLDAVRLMKIDIEGNEMTVFDGIDFYAPYAPENIICEFVPSLLPDSVTFEYYLEYFDQRGYRVCDVYGEPILTFRDNLPDSNLWIRRFSN